VRGVNKPLNTLSRTKRPWVDWPTRSRTDGLGHIYAVAYSSGAVKVGMTRDPRRRADTLRISAAQHGITITDAWLSIPHGEYEANEIKLHTICAALGPRWATETFTCSIHDVIAAAEELPMTEVPAPVGVFRPIYHGRSAARAEVRRQRVQKLRTEGRSYREIAAEVGCSIGTVRADLMKPWGAPVPKVVPVD
jgi:hypothetical protein